MRLILRFERRRREAEGKETEFFLKGRPVDPTKLRRFTQRKGPLELCVLTKEYCGHCQPLPDYITCSTPVDEINTSGLEDELQDILEGNRSGFYSRSNRVVPQATLVVPRSDIWVDPSAAANRFVDKLPKSLLANIASSGGVVPVPHIEVAGGVSLPIYHHGVANSGFNRYSQTPREAGFAESPPLKRRRSASPERAEVFPLSQNPPSQHSGSTLSSSAPSHEFEASPSPQDSLRPSCRTPNTPNRASSPQQDHPNEPPLTFIKAFCEIGQRHEQIHEMISLLRREDDDLSRQAEAFQHQHERHQQSINAMLTFFATVYGRSLRMERSLESSGPATREECHETRTAENLWSDIKQYLRRRLELAAASSS